MLLHALIGRHSGVGSNHEGETFYGDMCIEYYAALNSYLVNYSATLDCTVIHQEMVVFSPQLDGSFQALGHYSELKAAIPHRITQSDDQQLIMTSTPIEALDGYISEFAFSLNTGAFGYKSWWGFGGELTNNSQCDFVLL